MKHLYIWHVSEASQTSCRYFLMLTLSLTENRFQNILKIAALEQEVARKRQVR